MSEPGARKHRRRRRDEPDNDPRFLVFGLWVVVRMLSPDRTPFAVQCPHGQPIQYGTVISRGDGFDPEAGAFRPLPPIGSVAAFEESPEGIEGHYFFVGDQEYRVVHLDVINIAFPVDEPE
ncbi:MAG: hypothetical protein JXA90_07830 [Planctomycetes bacterium]|nr:hypothetical protein [Planctomycetota bacterium]